MSFNQDDNDMEDIGHERDAGQLDDNKNPGQDDDDSTNGWTYVTYKKKKDAERKESATSKSNFSPPNPRKAGQMIAGGILNSSKMPKLPEGRCESNHKTEGRTEYQGHVLGLARRSYLRSSRPYQG
ncbi:hypothetical protein MTO96_044657 [Rhipicephalus appendiculatus]